MKTKSLLLLCLFLGLALVITGCGKKADENKPISQVQAEASKMSVDQLRAAALSYKDTLAAKKAEVDKLAAKLKSVPLDKMLSEDTKKLKTDMENVGKSVSALSERLKIYVDKIKEKGSDVSGL